MKVNVTFDFDHADRMAIAAAVGQDGPATRSAMYTWLQDVVTSALEELRTRGKKR